MPDRLLRKCTAPACLEARDEVVPIYFGEDPYKGVSTAQSAESQPDQTGPQRDTIFARGTGIASPAVESGAVQRRNLN